MRLVFGGRREPTSRRPAPDVDGVLQVHRARSYLLRGLSPSSKICRFLKQSVYRYPTATHQENLCSLVGDFCATRWHTCKCLQM